MLTGDLAGAGGHLSEHREHRVWGDDEMLGWRTFGGHLSEHRRSCQA